MTLRITPRALDFAILWTCMAIAVIAFILDMGVFDK